MIPARISLFVPGEPVPKGRPRMTRGGHAYTPAKTRSYEGEIAFFGNRSMGGKPPLESPLHVDILVVMGVPPSWSQRKKSEALAGRLLPSGRKDLDNFVKTLDGLNGIVWKDDGQICSLNARKVYGEIPGLTIVIQEIQTGPRPGISGKLLGPLLQDTGPLKFP